MEIHIGNRVADVTLVSKEGNKVRLSIDGKPYDVDIVMTENGSVLSCTMGTHLTRRSSPEKIIGVMT